MRKGPGKARLMDQVRGNGPLDDAQYPGNDLGVSGKQQAQRQRNADVCWQELTLAGQLCLEFRPVFTHDLVQQRGLWSMAYVDPGRVWLVILCG